MSTQHLAPAAGTTDDPLRPKPARTESHARRWEGTGLGFVAKLVLMALVNGVGVMICWSAYLERSWAIFTASLLLLLVANWVYFTKRSLSLKYILPGLVFLLVFQLFSMAYTLYVATTTYGTGHNATKDQAVDALLIQSERRADDAPTYPLTILERDGEIGFAIVADGVARVGTALAPLSEAADATIEDDRVVAVPGWELVPRADILGDPALQESVLELRVPVSGEADDGSIRTREGTSGAVYRSALVWDPEADTMTNTETGVVYHADDGGQFVSDDGESLPVGWRVGVGMANFTKALSDTNYYGPLLRITGWTFAFALISVATSFLFGLVLAMVFNDPKIRGRKVIRTLFILPYAFPAFMSFLLFRGMLNVNPDYGIINNLFFFDARIPWLEDPLLAKIAVIGVNLWLTYPYWFLICTGALQSLPGDVLEAARIDGAGRWRTWRSVIMPLLLVSTAPLVIASFAFTFNNFTIIYMLTGGGPRFTDTSATLGHTDILISMIYQVSGVAGGRADYGLASALSIVVFVIVGTISALAFRRTRQLEEIL